MNQHIIKLDTAKEMAMLERNEKGKQVRHYFIQVEKKYKNCVNSGLSLADYLRLIEIISSCGDDRFPYISTILENMGLWPVQKQEPQHQAGAWEETVSEFLRTADVMNRPTNEVYQEYAQYCSQNGRAPISTIVFSKTINRILGIKVIDKKINGIKRRVFVPAGEGVVFS